MKKLEETFWLNFWLLNTQHRMYLLLCVIYRIKTKSESKARPPLAKAQPTSRKYSLNCLQQFLFSASSYISSKVFFFFPLNGNDQKFMEFNFRPIQYHFQLTNLSHLALYLRFPLKSARPNVLYKIDLTAFGGLERSSRDLFDSHREKSDPENPYANPPRHKFSLWERKNINSIRPGLFVIIKKYLSVAKCCVMNT